MSRFDVRRDAKLRQLAKCGPFVAASLCEVKRRCGHPSCRCARGQVHRAWVLTRKLEGKTQTVHVAKELVGEVQQWVKQYEQLKRLVRQITDANIAILRHHGRQAQSSLPSAARPPVGRQPVCLQARL